MWSAFFYNLNEIVNISGIIYKTKTAEHVLKMSGLGEFCYYRFNYGTCETILTTESHK